MKVLLGFRGLKSKMYFTIQKELIERIQNLKQDFDIMLASLPIICRFLE